MIKHAYQTWRDSHALEEIDLGLSVGESIQDPAVDLAVTLSDPFIDQAKDDFVWDGFAVVLSLSNFHLDWWVTLGLGDQDLLR